MAKKSYKGQTFSRLTILEDGGTLDKVLCQCECGNVKRIRQKNVTTGSTKSCGCLAVEHARRLGKTSGRWRKTHGLSRHPAYLSRCAAVDRCHKPTHDAYHLYGALGTYVCEEWRKSGKQFIDDMLPTWFEGACLDKDKYAKPGEPKCYSPETCCWISTEENNFIRNHPELYPISRLSTFDPFISYKLATT